MSDNGFTAAPSRYMSQGRETIDRIRDALGFAGFRAYCVGTQMRYLDRDGAKGDPEGDAEKAAWYGQMIAHLDRQGPDPRANRPGFQPYRKPVAPIPSSGDGARMCEYHEVQHLVEESWEEGLLTRNEPGSTQWFGYRLFPLGMLATSAVKRLEDGTFYFCGSYTHPCHRDQGFGAALMRQRVQYAVDQGATSLLVYSLKPDWYLRMGWEQEGVRPSGAMILRHRDPIWLLGSIE